MALAKEIRALGLKLILVVLILAMAVTGVLLREMKTLNQSQIRANTALVGVLVNRMPELEEEIVRAFLGQLEEGVEIGQRALEPFSYDEGLDWRQNPPLRTFFWRSWPKTLGLIMVSVLLLGALAFNEIRRIHWEIQSYSRYAAAAIDGVKTEPIARHQEGDLPRLAHQLESITSQLQESRQAGKRERVFLKDTITNISHQLKTPISALVMFNEILRQNPGMDPQEREGFLVMSMEQLDRMAWLITNLLKMARLDAGVVEFSRDEASIEETLEKAVGGAMAKAQSKKQRLTLRGSGVGRVRHDPEWTAEALSNIILNAVEHTPEEGQVDVCWEETPLSIQIDVRDTGPGIPLRDLGRVFQRFYKGPDSSNPSSVGIGLALAREIIEVQGGSITVQSQPGVGTCFTVTLLKIWV